MNPSRSRTCRADSIPSFVLRTPRVLTASRQLCALWHSDGHAPASRLCAGGLRCAVLCCAALRCAALCCAVLRCAALRCAVLCCAVLCLCSRTLIGSYLLCGFVRADCAVLSCACRTENQAACLVEFKPPIGHTHSWRFSFFYSKIQCSRHSTTCSYVPGTWYKKKGLRTGTNAFLGETMPLVNHDHEYIRKQRYLIGKRPGTSTSTAVTEKASEKPDKRQWCLLRKIDQTVQLVPVIVTCLVRTTTFFVAAQAINRCVPSVLISVFQYVERVVCRSFSLFYNGASCMAWTHTTPK